MRPTPVPILPSSMPGCFPEDGVRSGPTAAPSPPSAVKDTAGTESPGTVSPRLVAISDMGASSLAPRSAGASPLIIVTPSFRPPVPPREQERERKPRSFVDVIESLM
jgi:hypothetical protein